MLQGTISLYDSDRPLRFTQWHTSQMNLLSSHSLLVKNIYNVFVRLYLNSLKRVPISVFWCKKCCQKTGIFYFSRNAPLLATAVGPDPVGAVIGRVAERS